MEVTHTDFVPPSSEILAHISTNGATAVTMHDGSMIRFTSVPEGYDPTDRQEVFTYLTEHQNKGLIPTGLLFVDESMADLHEQSNTPDDPLYDLPYEKLCPGSAKLGELMEDFR
jgi:2-oxoglutarate ferredoxin oxidoreductase subunit beta